MINTTNIVEHTDSTQESSNILDNPSKFINDFISKGYKNQLCNSYLNDPKRQTEIEHKLDEYRNAKDGHEKKEIGERLYYLVLPAVIKGFNLSFKDPYMYKKKKYEVEDLRSVFVNESIEIFETLLEYQTKRSIKQQDSLRAFREKLISLTIKRSKTFVFLRTVDAELRGYHVYTKAEKHLRTLEEMFKEEHGYDGSDEELAKYAGCNVDTIVRIRRSINVKNPLSLDDNVSDDENNEVTLGECVESDVADFQTEDKAVFNAEFNDAIKFIQSILTTREFKRYVKYHYFQMSEYDIAKSEVGYDADKKKISTCQRSVDRDLKKAQEKIDRARQKAA